MRRREFVAVLSGAVAWAFEAGSKKVWRVGVVTGEDDERRRRMLEENIARLGYTPNVDFTVSLSTVVPSPKNYERQLPTCFPTSMSW